MKTQDQNLDIFREPEESQETAEIQFILDQAANESAPVRLCLDCKEFFSCTKKSASLDNCLDFTKQLLCEQCGCDIEAGTLCENCTFLFVTIPNAPRIGRFTLLSVEEFKTLEGGK